jgi:hypothetical protein
MLKRDLNTDQLLEVGRMMGSRMTITRMRTRIWKRKGKKERRRKVALKK